MTTQNFDETRSEEFADRLTGIYNSAALSLMISVGHRTGLFDVMAKLPPSGSDAIAEAAGLNERYVREWLNALAVGQIVTCDPDGLKYSLAPEHAAWLTREATPDNLAVYAQYIAVLGSVEDQIVDCFKNGGGVPYEEFHRFHEVMAEDSGQTVLPALIDQILPLAPGIVPDLEMGIDVLDVGCGRGRALILMAARFPNSRFWGYDLSPEAIKWAREEAAKNGVANVTFESRDLSDFSLDRTFDLVCAFDAIHDQADPVSVLQGICRVLSENGTFLMQDIHASSHVHKNSDHPIGALMYTISCMHCMTVSLAQGGAGLGAMWGEETARKMLADAGFSSVSVSRLPHDIQNTYYVARPLKAA